MQLNIPADFPNTLTDALCAAARSGNRTIWTIDDSGVDSQLSYEELRMLADKFAGGLARRGLSAGDRVLLEADSAVYVLPAVWGCLRLGIIPCLTTNRSLFSSQGRSQQTDFYGLANCRLSVHAQSAGDLHRPSEFSATYEDVYAETGPIPSYKRSSDDVALILFTSGSTGTPKCVPLKDRHLLSMALGTSLANDFNRDDVTLNWFGLDHAGAIAFLHMMPTILGNDQVHLSTHWVLADVVRWLQAIERRKATISWAPNFVFRMILDQRKRLANYQLNLSSMRFLVSAAEQVQVKTIAEFESFFGSMGLKPGTVRPAFGMSETCSGITWARKDWRSDEVSMSQWANLGPPIPGAGIRIVNEFGDLCAESVEGELEVSGPSVFDGYLGVEGRKDFFDSDWFRTGDLGFIKDGCLFLVGRKKETILINGRHWPSAEIESAASEAMNEDLEIVVACGVRDSTAESEQLVLFISTKLDHVLDSSGTDIISTAVAERIGRIPDAIVRLKQNDWPRTAIGKISRQQLKNSYGKGLYKHKVISRRSSRLWSLIQISDIYQPVESSAVGYRTDFHGRWAILGGNTSTSAELARQLVLQQVTVLDSDSLSASAAGSELGLEAVIDFSAYRLVEDCDYSRPDEAVFEWYLSVRKWISHCSPVLETQDIWVAIVVPVACLSSMTASPLLCCLNRTAQSLIASLNAEFPALRAVCIEIDDHPASARRILCEYRERGRHSWISYRHGWRFIRVLQVVNDQLPLVKPPRDSEITVSIKSICLSDRRVLLETTEQESGSALGAGVVLETGENVSACSRSDEVVVMLGHQDQNPGVKTMQADRLVVCARSASSEESLARISSAICGRDVVKGDATGHALLESSILDANNPLAPVYHWAPSDHQIQVWRWMRSGQHSGPVVLGATTTFHAQQNTVRWKSDRCYLITGGMGGVGRLLAQELGQIGVGKIVLSGRSSPSAEQQLFIADLKTYDVPVEYHRADMGEIDDVKMLIDRLVDDPIPLAGVFHLAGIASRGLLRDNLETSSWRSKAEGAWNLHLATIGLDLDWWVMFSSIESMQPSPGLSDYSASNAFMDGLVAWRRELGLCALSINWGAFHGVGMSSRQLDANAGNNIYTDLIEIIEKVAKSAVQAYPCLPREGSTDGGFRHTETYDVGAWDVLKQSLSTSEPSAQVAMLHAALEESLCRFVPISRPTSLDDRWVDLGLDSILSLQWINQLEMELGRKIPPTSLARFKTVGQLIGFVQDLISRSS